MTQEQRNLITEFGFCVGKPNERGKTPVSCETIPDLFSLEMLILTLTFQDEIHYWDKYRKSPSDPGGYVTALRLDNDRVAFREGNHGWMTGWYVVSVKELALHMQKNWDKDHDRGKYLNRILIEENKYYQKWDIKREMKPDYPFCYDE